MTSLRDQVEYMNRGCCASGSTLAWPLGATDPTTLSVPGPLKGINFGIRLAGEP